MCLILLTRVDDYGRSIGQWSRKQFKHCKGFTDNQFLVVSAMYSYLSHCNLHGDFVF